MKQADRLMVGFDPQLGLVLLGLPECTEGTPDVIAIPAENAAELISLLQAALQRLTTHDGVPH